MPYASSGPSTRLKVLILNQAFYPDVAATAQHASDLGLELAAQGHSVTALASTRCYDKPELRYSKEENWQGISIQRIWSSGFGKRAKWRRFLDFGTFMASCIAELARMPKQDVVIALTSPPLISFLAALMVRLKGGRLVFWVMDLNPDEAIAAGWLSEKSLFARLLESMLRFSLRSSEKVIALDRFMADRLKKKGVPDDRIAVLPPWSHSEAVSYDSNGRDQFRARHGMTGKFVVMYSGNHSPCHPLDTVLSAARQLRNHDDILFAFIGGGSEFRTVQRFRSEEKLDNILCLPYQPMEVLSSSLSSADLQVVVMGEPFVGIVHPCKIYNIMTLGIPVLYVGPDESHVSDIAQRTSGKWFFGARHGETERVVQNILEARDRSISRVTEEVLAARIFSQQRLAPAHVAVIASAATGATHSSNG